MSQLSNALEDKVALVTGAAARIGAVIVRTLHAAGMRVVLHYRSSSGPALALADELNAVRSDSVRLARADLADTGRLPDLIDESVRAWNRLDVLVNNASSFYPTPVGSVTEAQWDELMGPNLKAPFFLAQAAAPQLARQQGCIVSIVDIHAERPMPGYPVYSMAKAGLVMMTRSLARELGPDIRVNGVAPGAILWPSAGLEPVAQEEILSRTALRRSGEPADIARAVLFLVRDAGYVTGQVIAVDGGRSLNI